MLLQASLKSQRPGYCRAKGRHPARDPLQGSFGRKPRFHVIVGLKGDVVRKNCSNFENSNQLECEIGSFFLFGYFIQSILNKIELFCRNVKTNHVEERAPLVLKAKNASMASDFD